MLFKLYLQILSQIPVFGPREVFLGPFLGAFGAPWLAPTPPTHVHQLSLVVIIVLSGGSYMQVIPAQPSEARVNAVSTDMSTDMASLRMRREAKEANDDEQVQVHARGLVSCGSCDDCLDCDYDNCRFRLQVPSQAEDAKAEDASALPSPRSTSSGVTAELALRKASSSERRYLHITLIEMTVEDD